MRAALIIERYRGFTLEDASLIYGYVFVFSPEGYREWRNDGSDALAGPNQRDVPYGRYVVYDGGMNSRGVYSQQVHRIDKTAEDGRFALGIILRADYPCPAAQKQKEEAMIREILESIEFL